MDPKKLKKPGEAFSLAAIDVPQGKFREQVDVVADELRQLAGNPEFKVDPLSAPYVLFVNGYTGVDTFVGGLYQNTEADIERRISNQKLECGYSEARPFKTINRAAIEAAIITSRSFFTEEAQKARALVSIVVAPGEYTAFNDAGLNPTDGNFPARADGFVPTDEELTSFNDSVTGGIILPRGCSLVSLDLRKTIIRPAFVPARAIEAADYSNRRSIFKVTGTGYYYGFTFKDAIGVESSHHLLSCFEFTPKAELDQFYSKILKSFASAGIDATNTQTRDGEFTITAPKEEEPEFDTDGVVSASPYIYNTSIRSIYGLCGVFANGAVSNGFRSMVIAQFTGVSLQKDLNCWQEYNGSSWQNTLTDYVVDYIKGDPNNIRMDPFQRSFHIRAVNDSIIQEVSVFAIGQGVHHWTETGGELTITNSNSNFGGCSGLSEGFKAKAAPQDGPYTFEKIKRAIDPFTKSSNIKRITLGNLVANQADDALELELTNPLDESRTTKDQPDLLVRDNYSLKENDYVWIENPNGPDYRARLAFEPYRGSDPSVIKIKEPVTTDADNLFNEEIAPGLQVDLDNASNEFPPIAGFTVYVRRFRDVRSVQERRYGVVVDFGSGNRLPPKDYVLLQTGLGEDSNQVGSGDRVVAISSNEIFENETTEALLELRAAKRREQDTEYDPAFYYRPGDVVRKDNKHFIALRITFGTFNPDDWDENYVHMEEGYAPGGFFKSKQPILIFDKDTDGSENSTTLGNILSDVNNQLRSGTDYVGVQELLRGLGVGAGDTNNLLQPVSSIDDEFLDVRSESFNQDLECRRPSVVRMFGQAYEWTGFLNYSKALPNYQQVLSPSNKFSYYFTSGEGGIVYANGFNEEGLAVSPRGLEDVNTGQFLSLESVGSPDRSIDLPQEFENLTIKETLKVEGVYEGPEAEPYLNSEGKDPESMEAKPFAPGEREKLFGIVSLASAQRIQDPLMGSMAAVDSNDITAEDVMTLKSTNLWAKQQGFITARSGVQKVYVDPVNGANRSGQKLFDNPPTMPTMACKSIKAAAEFINATYSVAEKVQLLLGPGVYKETGTIILNPIMEVKSFNLQTGSDLCDERDSDTGRNNPFSSGLKSGQIPFMGQAPDPDTNLRAKVWNQTRAYLETTENHPCFLTRPFFRQTGTSGQKLFIEPFRIGFATSGKITGCVWFGLATTIEVLDDDEAVEYFPTFTKFPADENKAQAIKSVRDVERVNRLSKYIEVASISGLNLSFLETRTCIYSAAELEVINCAFEAIGPATRFSGNRNERAVIGCSAENVNLRGLWFIGNCKIDGSLYPGMPSRGDSEGSNYLYTGHHNAIVSSELVEQEENGISLLLGFGGGSLFVNENERDYNLTFNNFHFVNDDLKYAGSAPNGKNIAVDFTDQTANLAAQPPAFKGIIARVENLQQFSNVWNSVAAKDSTDLQGLGGYLGKYINTIESTTPQFTKGIAEISPGTTFSRINKEFFFQVAGVASSGNPSGVADPDFDYDTLNPGQVTTITFVAANIETSVVKQGIDVVTAITAAGNVQI